jgi:glutathione synthase/RimK-type ligase-like ATP-grasp enzyme
VVINWGASSWAPDQPDIECFNHPSYVALAKCKLQTFETFANGENTVNVPPWSRARADAEAWFSERGGAVVFCRTILNGSCGRGIVVAERVDQLVDAPLYVKYVPKREEYRVHVLRGNVIDVQRKGLRSGVTDPNYRIRSHDNGFVFMREAVQAPHTVIEQAIAAVQALGLDFGAVDVIWNERHTRPYVLEVNTAPGLTGTTVSNYAAAFQREYN